MALSKKKLTKKRAITKTDNLGNEHMIMHFYVEGVKNRGRVVLHLIRRPSSEYQYKYLYLDVQGHERIFLENADKPNTEPARRKFKFLGVSWS